MKLSRLFKVPDLGPSRAEIDALLDARLEELKRAQQKLAATKGDGDDRR